MRNTVSVIESIYSRLQDEISIELFNARLDLFYKGGDAAEYILSKSSLKKILEEAKTGNNSVILYGAGTDGKTLLDYCGAEGINVICFCDSDSKKWNEKFHGHSVISPSELMEKYPDSTVFISSVRAYHEILKSLKRSGFTGKVLDWFCTGWPQSDETRKYFGEPFIVPAENEVLIDAGAYVGDDIERFIKFCNNSYKRIFAVEPSPAVFEKMCVVASKYKNVVPVNKGVYSCTTKLPFVAAGDSTSYIALNEATDSFIEVICIDDLADSEDVTFIKMDIEGAELKALKGAENTIKRCKPKLAICVYHKSEDVLQIPCYILSLVPEYRLFIRHYSRNPCETVLYAVV